MPQTNVRGPDGVSYKVTHPDGASPQQILAYAKTNFGGESASTDPSHQQTRGFLNNLRLPWASVLDMFGSPAGGAVQEGLFHNALNWFKRGEETEEQEQAAYEPVLKSINDVLADMENQGMEDTPEYQEWLGKLDQAISQQEQSEVSEFSFGDLVTAVQDDAGAVAAEFANAIIADPALMMTPLGARTVASKAAATVASRGRVVESMARIAGGAGGAAATGMAITLPISIASQGAESGNVDWGRVWNETSTAGLISAPIGGLFGAASGLSPLMFRRSKPINTADEVEPRSVGAAATTYPGNTLEEAVGNLLRRPNELLKEGLDFAGRKSITYLDEAAGVSPAMRSIRNALEYTEFSDEAIPSSFFERLWLSNGHYVSRLQDTMDSLSGTFSTRISKAINDEILNDLRGISRATGEATQAVSKQLRSLLDDLRNYAEASDLDIGYVENYFPRVYRLSEANRSAFVSRLSKHMPIEDADVVYRRIINEGGVLVTGKTGSNRIIDDAGDYRPSRLGEPSTTKKNRNLETARTLAHIPDEELAPFLEGNVYDVLRKYTTAVTRRAEYAKMFGPGEGRLNRLMRQAVQESDQAGRPLKRAEIQRVYDLADAAQLKYKPFQTKVMSDLNKGLGTYQLLRTLSLATISSLSEPFIILARGRLDSTLKQVPKVLGHVISGSIRSVFKRYPKAEATRALENVGIGLDIGITERLMSSFGGEATRVSNAFFKATLLHQLTRMNRVAGFHAGRQMVIDNIRDLASGTLRPAKAKRFRHELAELGIDPDEGISMFQRGALETQFKGALDAAGLRFTNEVVMSPRPTNRPMWQSNPHWHLFSQLKGFQTTFGNTVMKRWFHEIFQGSNKSYHAAKIGATGALMVYVAMLGNQFREFIKYGPDGNPKYKNETFESKLVRAVDRAGFTGVFQFGLDAVYAHRFGASSISQLAGPTASQAEQIVRGVGMAFEGDTSKLELELANSIPFANTHRPARDEIREIIEESID